MKKSVFFIILVMLIFVSGVRAAPINRLAKIQEQFIIMRNWKLMKELNLSEKKAYKVFNILDRFDKQRQKLILKRKRLLNDIMNEVKRPLSSERRLKYLINELVRTNDELAMIPKREIEALKEVFNTKELARYILFSEKFSKQAKRLLYKELKNKKMMMKK